MLLPAYTKRYLPESITTRPVQGEVPTLDLVLAYHKANKSPILKLLLSKIGKLAGAVAKAPRDACRRYLGCANLPQCNQLTQSSPADAVGVNPNFGERRSPNAAAD